MTNKMYICWVGVNRYWSPMLLKMLVLAINNKSLQQKISTRKCTTEWFHKNMPNRFSPGLGHPMALNLWGAPSRPGSGLAQARAYLLGPGHQKQGERESVFYFYSAQLEFYVPHNIDIDSVAGHFALVVEHCLRVLVWQDPAGKAHAMSVSDRPISLPGHDNGTFGYWDCLKAFWRHVCALKYGQTYMYAVIYILLTFWTTLYFKEEFFAPSFNMMRSPIKKLLLVN